MMALVVPIDGVGRRYGPFVVLIILWTFLRNLCGLGFIVHWSCFIELVRALLNRLYFHRW
jgi:F0F1-type ATP synthase membrane subunit a